MKTVYKYDAVGNYVEPVEIADSAPTPSNCTTKPLPQPNYKPVFKNGAWVETSTPPAPPPAEPSPIDELKRQQAQLNADLAAFMDYVFGGA
jgi:hypothetical protein